MDNQSEATRYTLPYIGEVILGVKDILWILVGCGFIVWSVVQIARTPPGLFDWGLQVEQGECLGA